MLLIARVVSRLNAVSAYLETGLTMDAIPPTTVDPALLSDAVNGTPRVVIHLLGEFRVIVDGREVERSAWKRRKARSLVKLLALTPRQMLHREQITDVLWPDLDGDAASGNLRLSLHLARRALRSVSDGSLELIHLQDEHLSLRGSGPETIWIDVEQFELAALAAHRVHDVPAYQAAIRFYSGDLLPEDRYEDWATAPREVLRETYLGLLIALARLHESQGEYSSAITALERVVTVDATHEDAHAGLIRLHALTGRAGQALRQYARLREALTRELDIEPSVATQRLHADIAAGRFPSPGLPSPSNADGEPVLTASSPPRNHNLPAPLTSFIGRQQELAEMRQILPTTRLMTLSGTGGSGKSRLALELARGLIGEFEDGIWLVELAPLTDPALVSDAVAAAVGVREQPGQVLSETLLDALQDRSLVLVLDNCEHLIDACASLAEGLLAACPHLRILATSREALRVPGGLVWQVPSLALPASSPEESQWSSASIDQLAQVEAVALFVNRVRWVRPSFVLTSEDADAVVQICQRLDGLPLALELAAARASILTPAQLAARLDDALGVLSGGSRTAPDRQKTLQATLDWSYALLDACERTLLRRLAVFAGGWTLGAAESVCVGSCVPGTGGSDDGVTIAYADVLVVLAQLVDKSLVQVEDSAARPASTGVRYRLLETVRQYAAAHLAASGDAERMGECHTAYYLSLVEEAEPTFTGPDQAIWLDRIDREHDNLRAALRWAFAHDDIAGEAELCATLWGFWYYRGHLVEGDRRLADLVRRIHDAAVPTLVRAKVLQGAGVLAWNRGDPERSAQLSQQSLSMFEDVGDRHGISATLHALGVVAEMHGDYEEATSRYGAALQLREELGDTAGAAITLHNLGNLAREQADLVRAAELYERGLALQRTIGNTRGVALALASLAVVALDQGNYASSAELSAQSLQLYQRLGAKSLSITATNNLGYAVLFQGDTERAVTVQAQCLRLATEAGDKRGIAYGLEGVAAAIALFDTTARGAEQAARMFGAADALRETLQVPLPPADVALNERSLAAAHRALADDTYHAAWLAGRALVLEDAVAEALAVGDSLGRDEGTQVEAVAPRLLSPREREVALLVARGSTNREIAVALGMANRTVDTHVSNLLRKLGLASRADVSAWVIEHDLVPRDTPSS